MMDSDSTLVLRRSCARLKPECPRSKYKCTRDWLVETFAHCCRTQAGRGHIDRTTKLVVPHCVVVVVVVVVIVVVAVVVVVTSPVAV